MSINSSKDEIDSIINQFNDSIQAKIDQQQNIVKKAQVILDKDT